MLTKLLLGFTLLGEEWVLWLLIGLSVVSVAIMIERAVFFLTNSVADSDELMKRLAAGDVEFAKKAVEGKRGMEASVVREAVNAQEKGAEAVEELVNATIAREKLRYDSWLAVLGTLGNNAPFIGLFGTVLGIIRAFADLAASAAGGKSNPASVMSGISGALVATAVGLAVAIPAVMGFNLFQRWLKKISSRATALAHAWQSHLKSRAHAEQKKAA
ncbi:MAG: MotA/TolQ/ExbB proton channel family protein [Myxococcales bacterium]